jgi:hypothetical protein
MIGLKKIIGNTGAKFAGKVRKSVDKKLKKMACASYVPETLQSMGILLVLNV